MTSGSAAPRSRPHQLVDERIVGARVGGPVDHVAENSAAAVGRAGSARHGRVLG